MAGGCLILLVIGIFGAAAGAAFLVKNFQGGGYSCLPSDFPSYPGSSVVREYTYYGTNVAPGDTRECQMSFHSQDDVSTVTDFYANRLNSGDWTLIANDTANGAIDFQSSSRSATIGTILLYGQGQHTLIEIRLDS